MLPRLALQRRARAGILLLARHRRDAVVEHGDGNVGFVVDGARQRRHAGVEEGAVADGGDGILLTAGLPEAVGHAHAGAHGDQHVHGFKGRQHAHGVAADVARNHDLGALLAQVVEEGAVRTAGTERGRTRRHRQRDVGLFRRLLGRQRVQQSGLHRAPADLAQRQLTAERDDVLAVGNLNARRF